MPFRRPLAKCLITPGPPRSFRLRQDSATTTGYAGNFTGNVRVIGTLSKTAGSFQIDDPRDPAHQYLFHSFVESPDMMDVYNGNITTMRRGTPRYCCPIILRR